MTGIDFIRSGAVWSAFMAADFFTTEESRIPTNGRTVDTHVDQQAILVRHEGSGPQWGPLDGVKVVDVKDTKHLDGPIALQDGAGTVKFRNVRIRTL